MKNFETGGGDNKKKFLSGRGTTFNPTPSNEEEANAYSNALSHGADSNYPVGTSECFAVGISGGCGPKCFVYLKGECGEPQEMIPRSTNDELAAHMELYPEDELAVHMELHQVDARIAEQELAKLKAENDRLTGNNLRRVKLDDLGKNLAPSINPQKFAEFIEAEGFIGPTGTPDSDNYYECPGGHIWSESDVEALFLEKHKS